MIVEKRTYVMHSGKMRQYLDAFADGGFVEMQKHLGHCVGFFRSETGPIEEVTQMWAYETWEDRETRRRALYENSPFGRQAEALFPLIQTKTSQILVPVDFAGLARSG